MNAYCPGIVGTGMWTEIDKRFAEITGAPVGETYKKYVEGIALGRAETPDDVASLVAYLAGPGFRLYDRSVDPDRWRDCLPLIPEAGRLRQTAALIPPASFSYGFPCPAMALTFTASSPFAGHS